MSTYRGEWIKTSASGTPLELSSGGTIEFCQGEVIDSLRLLDIVRQMSTVNPNKILMWGHSHGGCVTERAVEQGAPVAAAAAFDTPSDILNWRTSTFTPGLDCDLGQGVKFNSSTFNPNDLNNLGCVAQTQADPSGAPMAYSWRSSALVAADLKAATVTIPFLIVHGAGDSWVPVEQACELAYNAFGTSGTYWHYDTTPQLTTSAPTSVCNKTTTCPTSYCSQLQFPSQLPTTYKPGGYLAVYDNPKDMPPLIAHLEILDPTGQPWADFLSFTDSVIPQ
jgi:hypothetical protein